MLILALCLVFYNANWRLIATGDSYGARYLPFGIWRYHTLVLDPIAGIAAQGRTTGIGPSHEPQQDEWPAKAYWIVRGKDDHAISTYPVLIPALLTPAYLPAVLYLNANGWEPWRLDWVARIMEKFLASLLAAASAALMYLALRRRAAPRPAALLALAYAFGTTTWMIGSQALWQHGMAELLVAGLLLAVTGPCTPRAVAAAGLLCGLIACNRPPDSILAAGIGVYGLWWAGRRAPSLVAAALVPLVLLLAYNLGVAGHWAGGYGLLGAGNKDFFDHDPLTGLAGLLFSPARGLFVFSPFLLFIPFYARRVFRDRDSRFLTAAIVAAVVLQIALYAKTDWRQGAVWGPRWLTSMLPMLVWMLPPVLGSLRRPGRIAFVAACIAATAAEAIGAFWYTGASNAPIYAITKGPGAMRAAWDPRNAPFVAELRRRPVQPELSAAVRGSLDIARTTDGSDLSAASGNQIVVEGWATANGRTPREALVMLDGQIVASTQEFFVRPDVTKALGVRDASGWRLVFRAGELAAGDHLLAVFVRAVDLGDVYFLVDRRFTTTDAPVPAAQPVAQREAGATTLLERARQAAAAIAAGQKDPGYWLTDFTGGTSYAHPGQEMNTFLNAMMIDMLDPVAAHARLAPSVQRARRFLATQIEDGGLVRYHGRPDAPTIGTLGCAITPDADCTALLWRVAPAAHREWLPMALDTLRQYRTPEGLYRTWLAPRNRYQCIDPGQDPNPPDVAIQMHILMLQAKEDPPAARATCQALRNAIGGNKLWVYYQNAPLVPMLRIADLERAGCPLELPATRHRTAVSGQEVWMRVARMLQAPGPPPAEAAAALESLSRDNFLLLRQSPPLLYHNDLTASVPRFYWSRDFGYALWLRLYFASAPERSPAL